MSIPKGAEEAVKLDAEAHALLEEGRVDEALRISEQLLSARWSGAFEIKALALAQKGELEAAIATLEEGTAKVPSVWRLWSLLGNLRADAGHLDEALEAHDRALTCPHPDEGTVRFNRALVRHRRGEAEEVLADLEPLGEQLDELPFGDEARSLISLCLAEVGRGEEGLELIDAALAACADEDPREAALLGERALALSRLRRDATEAFRRAIEAGAPSPRLLALGRRLHPAPCDAPKRFRLIVEGELDDPELAGFMCGAQVVADDEAQALELTALVLPSPARLSLETAECIEDPTEAEPGVHWVSGRVYFGRE